MTAAGIGVRVAQVCRSSERVDLSPVAFRRPQDPIRPFLCTDALRLTDLLLETKTTAQPDVHALAALFCFDLARLPPAWNDQRVCVPLEEAS